MKKNPGLRRLFGNFKWYLSREVERGRQDGGTSPVCLFEPRCLDIAMIGIAIRLHEFAKPTANFTESMFHSPLEAEARPHYPQRSCEGSHEGCDRTTGWNRGR